MKIAIISLLVSMGSFALVPSSNLEKNEAFQDKVELSSPVYLLERVARKFVSHLPSIGARKHVVVCNEIAIDRSDI